MSAAIPKNPAITPLEPRPAPELEFGTAFRTHSCGELTKADKGKTVRLCGAIDTKIDDMTYLLRDSYGMTMVKIGPGAKAFLDQYKSIPIELETIVKFDGKVALRDKPDPKSATGEIAVEASDARLISNPLKAPLFDFHDEKLAKEQRIRHRYLYLRKPAAHENFRFRTQLLHEARRHLVQEGFLEVETPLLANKWTPEQTDAYLAIRARNEVFALPGRRPIHSYALMASGFDRTFEVSRRFRKLAKYNPWQQAEYDVLELHMAWVEESDLYPALDKLLFTLWQHGRKEVLETPVRTLPFEQAWIKFGTDAPDARFGLEIEDCTKLCEKAGNLDFRDLGMKGGAIRALLVKDGAKKVTEEHRQALAKMAPDERTNAISWYGVDANGVVERLGGTGMLEQAVYDEIATRLAPQPGDLMVVVVGGERMSAGAIAGKARTFLGRALGLIDPKKVALVRVTELPYYRWDAATGRRKRVGDPMTKPMPGDLDGDPSRMRQQAFYLSVNGINVGGGGIRNHDRNEQQKLFAALGLEPEEIDANYLQHMRLQDSGMPPFGRISIGVERLTALFLGLDGIDELIPMPKTPEGTCPLTRSPWVIENHTVRGLFGI